ncbi:MAG: DUF5615 family PIN-like protein [Saprospiraceae bacterium]|nr:DUF5615 family PIN-like protein [Saprospiraceae bacterium]
MNILLDMNISPEWVLWFRQAGFNCRHWSDVGMPSAKDADILSWALSNQYVVVTHDLDFGAILAATAAHAPSVIQIRMSRYLPEDAVAQRMNGYHHKYSDMLDKGALITIDETSHKVRMLPIHRQ